MTRRSRRPGDGHFIVLSYFSSLSKQIESLENTFDVPPSYEKGFVFITLKSFEIQGEDFFHLKLYFVIHFKQQLSILFNFKREHFIIFNS